MFIGRVVDTLQICLSWVPQKAESESKVCIILYWEVQSKETRVQKRGSEAGKAGDSMRVRRRGHTYYGNLGQSWGEEEGRRIIYWLLIKGLPHGV